MKNIRNVLKVSFLIIAFAISLAILSACNGSAGLPSEHFDGNCIVKGYTRYYMPNGTYVDREDKEFGEHSYGEGVLISERTCTTDEVTKFVCTICDNEKFDVVEKLGHDYKQIGNLAPTCTEDGYTDFRCERCSKNHRENLNRLGHDFKEEIIQQATCTAEGSKNLICQREGCSHSEVAAIEKLPHTPENKIYKDSVAHWKVCTVCSHLFDYEKHDITSAYVPSTCIKKAHTHDTCKICDYSNDTVDENSTLAAHNYVKGYNDEQHWEGCSVCGDRAEYVNHNKVSKSFPATCVEHAYTRVTCTECEFNKTVVDESSTLLPHSYEAYTCKTCQRDNILDYIDVFNSKGDTNTNLIEIVDENMFVCFYDWLIAYQITTAKYIKIKYVTLTDNTASTFLSNLRHKATATNWSVNITKFGGNNNFISYLSMCASDKDNFTFKEAATITPDTYNANTYKQYNSYQFEDKTALRANSFDSFKYKNRKNVMTVTSSDQLFFAFEHGYMPSPVSGSSAERLLTKAKAVARRIMNDGMSDLQKSRAIFSWLVSDIAYDNGIVAMGDSGNLPFAKYTSYYLEGVFDHGIAVCDGISKAFCVLAGLEDIKCVRVTSTNHAWNKLYLDLNGDGNKQWYCTDATWGNQSVNYDEELAEYFSIENFLFTDAQKKAKNQNGLNYVSSEAKTEANPFAHFNFDSGSNGDYVIESETEFILLIDYMKNNYSEFATGNKVTVQIFVVTAFCASYDEVGTRLPVILRNHWQYAAFSISETTMSYSGQSGYTVGIIFTKK